MMKRFFTVMLGSLAAIWISISLLFLLFIVGLGVLIASAFADKEVPDITKNSILYINLGTTVGEIQSRPDLETLLTEGDTRMLLLQPAIDAIREAENDPRIEGIYIDAEAISSGAAALKSLHDALKHFKDNSGKWIVAYGDQITQGSYLLASLADELYINPQGMLDIHGLSASIMFYKGLFEKLGVEVQVLKVGTFKSAVEPYILDSISEPNRLQMKAYMGAIWNNMAEAMGDARGLTVEEVNQLADSMLLTVSAPDLVEKGLVDQTLYRHQVEDLLREKVNVKKDKRLPLVDIENYYDDIFNNLKRHSENKIAVLYAVGEITEDGSEGITSADMVPRILSLADDEDIKGMVLRVNSPGGSAFASEQIWEALEVFKATGKKLYVSMGNVAASGGYYISCGADKIYASPVTVTGSIGIFGLIPNVKGLLNDKLGINVGTVNTNRNGDFPTLTSPMTPFQQASMQNMINRGYETFVGRCAQGRNLSVDSIKSIAEGRVWAGVIALEIGLVDELGDLDEAIGGLVDDLGIANYEIDVYPKTKFNFWDLFTSAGAGISARVMRHALGEEAYELYRKAKRVETMDPVQCRMEDVELSL